MRNHTILEMLQFCIDEEHEKKIIFSCDTERKYSLHEEAEAMRDALSFCVKMIVDSMESEESIDSLKERLSAINEINKIQDHIAFIKDSLTWWEHVSREENEI